MFTYLLHNFIHQLTEIAPSGTLRQTPTVTADDTAHDSEYTEASPMRTPVCKLGRHLLSRPAPSWLRCTSGTPTDSHSLRFLPGVQNLVPIPRKGPTTTTFRSVGHPLLESLIRPRPNKLSINKFLARRLIHFCAVQVDEKGGSVL